MTTLLILAVLFVGVLVWWCNRVEPRRLVVSYRTLHIPELPEGSDGVRIVHLSDFHFREGEWRDEVFFQRLLDLQGDLFLYTGDFIEDEPGIERAKAFFAQVPEFPAGKFAVLGNHDHYFYSLWDFITRVVTTNIEHDMQAFSEEMQKLGVTVLSNEVATTTLAGMPCTVAGLDDPVTSKLDDSAVLPTLQGASGLRILLVHSPDYLADKQTYPAEVAFSGHTHGGQIVFPFLGELTSHSQLRRGFSAGAYLCAGVPTNIVRGLGMSKVVPFRLFNRPEASVIELRRGPHRLEPARWYDQPPTVSSAT